MARLARLTLAGQPHHVYQRGNNRQSIFVDAADRERFLALLAEGAARQRVALHAYVLMDDHFHLLATPPTAEALPLWMQGVGRSYVRYFNDRHARSGTLWEGRYRSTLIQVERYLLPCMVYMDLNPVRHRVVTEPQLYPWSSHAHYIGQRQDRWVVPHALYWALGNTPFDREAAYAALVHGGVGAAEMAVLTQTVLKGWVAGDAAFVAKMQTQTERRLRPSKAGRPPSSVSDSEKNSA